MRIRIISASLVSNFLLLLIIIVGLSNAGQSVVACFGDSITGGWPIYKKDGNGCVPPCGGYEPPLQNYLRSAGRDVIIMNYGLPGELSSDGVGRIDSVLAASNPKYVLLMEGTNDALFFSPSTIRANLEYMVNRAIARNVIPILGTITPDLRSNKPIPTINNLLKQLAQDRNILLADHYAAMINNWGSLNSDKIHPNALGYSVMAQTWAALFSTIDPPVLLTDAIRYLQVLTGLNPSGINVLVSDINNNGMIGIEEAIDALKKNMIEAQRIP